MSTKDNKERDTNPNPVYAKYQNKPRKLTKRERRSDLFFWIGGSIMYFYSIYELTLGHEKFVTRRGRYQFSAYLFVVVFTPFFIYEIFFLISKLIKIIKAARDKDN